MDPQACKRNSIHSLLGLRYILIDRCKCEMFSAYYNSLATDKFRSIECLSGH